MTNGLHIAMVSEHASPLAVLGGVDAGGQNVHVAALAEHLAALGHRVSVFTRRESSTDADRVDMRERVTVHHLSAGPPDVLPKDELFPFMADLSDGLRRSFIQDPPDLVHAHFWMSGWASLRAARPLRIPVVQTFHALGVVKRRHQGSADTSPPEREATERVVLRHVAHIVATCSDEVRELQALDPRCLGRVTVVPCGVDAVFAPRGPVDPEPRRERHRLVAVSRLVPRKGIDDAIRALVTIPETELVIAGGPPLEGLESDAEVARLRRIASDLGVDDRVAFRGRLDREGVAALLRSADLAVCPPWYEPFGIVPLEAMACGVPVVGSATGGLLDSVVPDVTGRLVAPQHPFALARAVRQLLRDPVARRRMGRAAARRASRLYSWHTVAQQTADVYQMVVQPGARQITPAVLA